MRSKTTIEIYTYWEGLRSSRAAPSRSEIDPSKVRHILPDLFILERTSRGDIRFRLAGTRICALFSRELRGSRFDSLWLGAQTAQLASIASKVMTATTPLILSAVASNGTGDELPIELVLLPLRSPNGGIDRIIGSLTPLARPTLFEATPVNFLELKNAQAPDAQGVDSAAPHRSQEATVTKSLAPSQNGITGVLRRVLHLRVLEGGRPD